MRAAALVVAILVHGLAPSAGAQPAADAQIPQLELWAGVSVPLAAASGELASAYSPPLLLDGDFTSHAGQTLTFSGHRTAGFEGGANLFLARRAGIQVLVDRTATDVSGVNGPYDVSLHYISRQPPNDELVPVDVGQTMAWPDSTGSIMQLTLSINGVARIGQPHRVSLRLSGGLSYYRLSGSLEPLGFTAYHLGGHSVLFEDDYRLAVSLEPVGAVGFNGGGDVDVPIRKGVAFTVGYRFFDAPTVDVPVRVATILNADQVSFQQPMADIQQRLALAPADIRLSGSHVVLGLKLVR